MEEQIHEEASKEKVFGRKGFEEKPMHETQASDLDSGGKSGKGDKQYSTTSQYLFREINLFLPETIAVGIAVLCAVFLGAFGYLFNSKEFILIGLAVPVIVLVLFYLARFLLFMPNKNRYLTHRLLSSGAIRTSVDDVRSGSLKFDKAPLSPAIRILNPRKHIDHNTGKPVLILREGAGENVSLNMLTNSQQAQEINSVIDSVWGLAEAYTRYNIKKADDKKQMFMILLLIGVAVLTVGAAYISLQNQQILTDFVNAATPLLKKAAEYSADSTAKVITTVMK